VKAAGLADSCSAVVTMAFAYVASHGLVAVATSWTFYAVVACGIGNVLLTQTAYQAGRPMITLPIISAVTPVASAAIGIGLLGETPRVGLLGGIAAGFAVLVTSLALACLARSAPQPGPSPQPGPQSGRSPRLERSPADVPEPVLALRTSGQFLADVSASLGLPDLPSSIGNSPVRNGSSMYSLLAGSRTVRVWCAGQEHSGRARSGTTKEALS
jgi:hypothetical protein